MQRRRSALHPPAPRSSAGRHAVLAVLIVLTLVGGISAGCGVGGGTPDSVAGDVGGPGVSGDPNDVPANTPGRVLWDGNLASGNLDAYTLDQCQPGRISVVRDPLGVDRNVAKFNVRNSDVSPCTPTENPRAQAQSPNFLQEGNDYWIGWSTLFPADFPRWPDVDNAFFTFESTYGPPYSDTGPRHLNLLGDPERIGWQRNREYDYDIPWSMPMVRGRWVDFVVHVKQSEDPEVGFVELWVNTGQGWRRQLFPGGQRTIYMRTLDDSNNGGANAADVRVYFKEGMYDDVTVYHADHKVGTSFSVVAPDSYGTAQGG